MNEEEPLSESDREEKEFEADKKAGYYQPPAETESVDETARKSGMAYTASLSLAVSVVLGLGLGAAADYFLKTSPWGILIGIILGGALGFYLFFSISSQIFEK